jgi:membrane protease YdiL (CAAX protease family)
MDSQQTYTSPEFTAAQPAPQHGFFMGRFGLRAGWGILIYLVLFCIFLVTIVVGDLAIRGKLKPMIQERQQAALAAKNHTAPPAPKAIAPAAQDFGPHNAAMGEGMQFTALALAAFLLSVFERRRIAVYGIGRNRLNDFLPGALWGLISLSVLVGLLRAFHLLVFDSLALHGAAILRYGLEWAGVFILVGLLEEYLLRGYLQYTLMRGLYGLGERISSNNARAVSFWMAAFVLSVLFACLHLGNSGENVMGIVMVFVAGIVFSYALWRTGSLWWAIGFHMAWDWAQSFLYGVPDSGTLSADRLFQTHPAGKAMLSGGSDGPEGSLLVVPVLLLVLVAIHFARPGAQPSLQPIPAEPEPSSASPAPAV